MLIVHGDSTHCRLTKSLTSLYNILNLTLLLKLGFYMVILKTKDCLWMHYLIDLCCFAFCLLQCDKGPAYRQPQTVVTYSPRGASPVLSHPLVHFCWDHPFHSLLIIRLVPVWEGTKVTSQEIRDSCDHWLLSGYPYHFVEFSLKLHGGLGNSLSFLLLSCVLWLVCINIWKFSQNLLAPSKFSLNITPPIRSLQVNQSHFRTYVLDTGIFSLKCWINESKTTCQRGKCILKL